MIRFKRSVAIILTVSMLILSMAACNSKETDLSSSSGSSSVTTESSSSASSVASESSLESSVSSGSASSELSSSVITSSGLASSSATVSSSKIITSTKASSSSKPVSGIATTMSSDTSGIVKNMNGRTVVFHDLSSGTGDYGPQDKHWERLQARIASVEKQYNCKIILNTDVSLSNISKSVMAGKPMVDIWETLWQPQLNESFLPSYVKGLFQPLEPLKCFNFKDAKYNNAPGLTLYIGGKHYGIMMDNSYLSSAFQLDQVMYYRPDLLQACGITNDMMPDTLIKNGQWTWDNFAKDCQKIRAAGKLPFSDYAGINGCHLTSLYSILCYEFNTDFIKQNSNTNLITFNGGSNAALQALDYYTNLVKNKIIDAPDCTKSNPPEMSAPGGPLFEIYSMTLAVWGFPQLGDDASKANWCIAYLPKLKATDPYTVISNAEIESWSIPYGVKNPKDAATVMQALTPLDTNTEAAKAETLIDYGLWLPSNPYSAGIVSRIQKEYNDIAYTTAQKWYITDLAIGPGVGKDWLTHVQKIATGQENAASVIKANTAKYNDLLKNVYTLR